jgi:hypothetical protein
VRRSGGQADRYQPCLRLPSWNRHAMERRRWPTADFTRRAAALVTRSGVRPLVSPLM